MALLAKTFLFCALGAIFAVCVPLFAGDPLLKTALEAASAVVVCLILA